MAPITLYYFPASAPCRVALLTIRNLNLDVEIREINLLKKEQLSEEFLKINPQHCLPTLVDDGFVMWESRPIAIYLVEKNFPDGHPLYPKDVKQRALINQRLQFDASTLYQRIRAICFPVIYLGKTEIDDADRQRLFEAVGFLNTFLEGNKFVIGSEEPTLADLSISASIANFIEIGGSLSKFPNVAAWFERCKTLPGYEENLAGAKIFGARVTGTLQEKL